MYPKSQLSVILFDILGLTVKVVNLNFEDAVQAEGYLEKLDIWFEDKEQRK